jgi:hypothetical protein
MTRDCQSRRWHTRRLPDPARADEYRSAVTALRQHARRWLPLACGDE